MKNLLCLLLFSIAFLSLSAQTPNWLNYTCGKTIMCLAEEGNQLWVGTTGGLVKLDKTSGQAVFYNRANSGLACNYINDVAIDSQGNKWIATSLGLNKFDGTNWAFYYPSGENPWFGINCLAIDNQDNIWAGSIMTGLYKFDGVSNWVNFTDLYPSVPFSYTCHLFIDNQQNLWVGTWNNLLKFNGSVWTVSAGCWSLIDDIYVYFHHMAIDGQNRIWASAMPAGLVKYNGIDWHFYSAAAVADSEDVVISLFCDSDNNIWGGTWHGKLVKFDGVNWTNYSFGAEPAFPEQISQVFIDNQNSLWIGTDGLYKQIGTDWTQFNTSNSSLQAGHLFDLNFDQQQNLWVASGNALSKLSGSTWTSYPFPSSIASINSVSDISADQQGRIWSVIYSYDQQWSGAACLDDQTWTLYDQTNSPINPGAYCLTVDNQNNVWVGSTSGNVFRFDGANWSLTHIPVPGTYASSVQAIGHDSQNNIWAFGYFGLAKYDGAGWTIYSFTDAGIEIGTFLSFTIDWQDNIWIGSKSGLARFNNGVWTSYDPENSGLPDYFVSGICVDLNGNLWARSFNDSDSGVLIKYDGITWTLYDFYNYPFTSTDIWDIVVDSNNNLWMGTDSGITVYNENGIVANADDVVPVPVQGRFHLSIYPNPFNPKANISYELDQAARVNLCIYDIKGRLVKQLCHARQDKGQHAAAWDGTDQAGRTMASGVYFCRIETSIGSQVKKLVLVK